MLYSFVNTAGNIVGDSIEFDIPPDISPAKGRWVQDIKPTYNEFLYTCSRVEPVNPDAAAVEYIVAPVNVDDARAYARMMINMGRMKSIVTGFTFRDKLIDANQQSVVNITAAATAAMIAQARSIPFAVTWTCADDSTLNLDAEGVLDLMLELAQHLNTQYVDARYQKNVMSMADVPTIARLLG